MDTAYGKGISRYTRKTGICPPCGTKIFRIGKI